MKSMKLIMETFKRKLKEEWEEEQEIGMPNFEHAQEMEARGVPESFKSHPDFVFTLEGKKGDAYKDMVYMGNFGYDAVVFKNTDGTYILDWVEFQSNGKEKKKKKVFQNPDEIPSFYDKAIRLRMK